MAAAVDISILGDKALERKLAALGSPARQKKAVRPALRKSAKRIKAAMVQNLSGLVADPQTGALRAAMAKQKIIALRRSRGSIGVGIGQPEFSMPGRADVGIDPKDPYYYPRHVEYGHPGVAPRPYIRSAVDRNRDSELAKIGADIGKGTEKVAAKPA